MDDYRCWNKHGEEGVNDRDMQADCRCQDDGTHAVGQDNEKELFWRSEDDEEGPFCSPDLTDDKLEDISANYSQKANDLEEMVRDAMGFDEYTEAELNKLKRLLADMRTPLYENCKQKYSKLFAALKLLQLKATHHWTDRSFDELLHQLEDMFPERNQLPKTTYEAKQIVCPMGLEVEKIHACKNDCILYHGKENSKLTQCPECGVSRYKRRNDGGDEDKRHGAPRKVVWYFPIVPRLKRLFATAKDAQLLSWHKEGRKIDGYLRHPGDAIQWRLIDSKYHFLKDEPRHIRFAMSTDGMNPFGNMSSSYSVWPVLLSIYNIPPWVCNRRKYMMMPLLISGPLQPGNDIDVYLRLVVDELKMLWSDGVKVYDGFKRESFKLHAMLVTTITDVPGHHCVSGQSKGEKGCFQCLDDTESVWLKNSKKRVYIRNRRFLPSSHAYRLMTRQFDGTVETRTAPRHYTGYDVYEQVKDVNVAFGKNKKSALGKRKREEEAVVNKRWKKKSLLWELAYWKDIAVRHSIDVMHLKKNVCGSILGTLMNTKGKSKDHENARKDMADMDIRPELRPEAPGGKLPLSAINLSREEKQELCDFFRSVKVPSGYSGDIRKLVHPKENKMLPMKAHDCDVMLTTMIAVGIRDILPEKVRMTIMSLCFFFNAISKKVLDESSLDKVEKNIFETMCLLEAYFPSAFFDVSVHLIAHVVKEIRYLGPVFLHHMYPYERFMSTLNRYTKNRARPEGSMVQGYSAEEVVDWCLGYIDPTNPIGLYKSRHEGRLAGIGTLGKKTLNPDPDDYRRAHFLVLAHTTEVTPYIEEHKDHLRQENPNLSETWIARAHMKGFNNWFKKRILNDSSCTNEELQTLAEGPLFSITSYQGYDINGYTFYTLAQDQKSVYQNSGVRVVAFDSTEVQKDAYYGQIEEIWELTYPGVKAPVKVAIFRCRWVKGKRGITKDKYGFTTVDFEQVGYKDEPFVLASTVSQVFYVLDTRNKKRLVVLPGKKRVVGVEDNVDEEEYNQFDEVPSFADWTLPVILESEETPYLRQGHVEEATVSKQRRKRHVRKRK
jgi:hypothetical protein